MKKEWISITFNELEVKMTAAKPYQGKYESGEYTESWS